ncbi:L-lactate dehydrogenase [Corynebacterium sp. 3HC-13]|uniref:lactate/malate family dehydrogenase n=1 Tax=Corynebacterium poyangense TaxID=2684405 RepID=UPI001CCB5CCD|nr:L-lactate dehydrogenase [Corynebacterium poyangense]MBZ8176323.1 L-lactate dehydrogenase [Corynebacterium poyangense]
MSGHKLVLIGLGHVGDAVLAHAMSSKLFSDIALIDANTQLAEGQALDQHQATALPGVGNVHVHVADYDACADADVIIYTAGPSIRPDQAGAESRNLLAAKNASIVREVMAEITQRTRDAIIVMVSNPVDLLVHIAATEFDYPTEKIMGTGLLLDSARLCRIVADMLDIDPDFVHAAMLGEHGATGFPYMSGISVAGVPYPQFPEVFGIDQLLSAEELMTRTNYAGMEVLKTKGWTSAGVAASAITLAQSIMLNSKIVVSVSTLLCGEYGQHQDVSLSVPCIIGENGIEKRIEVPLDAWEEEKMQQSITALKKLIASVSKK